MQRLIEASGLPTVSLSNIPDLTAATGAPRVVAVEHPPGRLVGPPHDVERQRAVVRGLLQGLVDIEHPGGVVHLPLEYVESDDPAHGTESPKGRSPMVRAMAADRSLYGRFEERDVPEEFRVPPPQPADAAVTTITQARS